MNEYERQLGGSGSGDPQARERSPEEIEREIEATRDRMSRDIDELGERLNKEIERFKERFNVSDEAAA